MKIEGLITALVTPFDKNGQLDLESTEKLINRLISEGVDGLFILGTNGEFHVMENEEKIEFAEEVVRIANKRVPVYAGTGMNSTMETIELSKKIVEAGVDALSIITPYFIKLSDEELYEHYLEISKSVDIPILMYNIPNNTGNTLSPNVVARLAKIENIKGIKDSSGDIENIKAYLKCTEEDEFSVLSGSDSLILSALKAGATGAVAATSNVLTKTDKAIFDYFYAGDIEKAQEMQDSIEEFRRILKLGRVPSVLKHTLTLRGNPVGYARKPVLHVSEDYYEDINSIMDDYRLQERTLGGL